MRWKKTEHVRKDVATIRVELPGGSEHYVSLEVLLRTMGRVLRGQTIQGGSTTIRMDNFGQFYINEDLRLQPKVEIVLEDAPRDADFEAVLNAFKGVKKEDVP